MEFQQRDNETLAAYIHWFKVETKRFSFNSDTAAMHIINKSLWDTHNTAVKIYQKEPQTLLEAIRLAWCTVVQLWRVQQPYTGLPWQNPSIENTSPLQQVTFPTTLWPQPWRKYILLTTDSAMEDVLTSHNDTTNPIITEALATTKDMHPISHPTTTLFHAILWPTEALDNIHTGTHLTNITVTPLYHATFPIIVSLNVIPQTKTSQFKPLSPYSSKATDK